MDTMSLQYASYIAMHATYILNVYMALKKSAIMKIIKILSSMVDLECFELEVTLCILSDELVE